jgi:hypothetical protein
LTFEGRNTACVVAPPAYFRNLHSARLDSPKCYDAVCSVVTVAQWPGGAGERLYRMPWENLDISVTLVEYVYITLPHQMCRCLVPLSQYKGILETVIRRCSSAPLLKKSPMWSRYNRRALPQAEPVAADILFIFAHLYSTSNVAHMIRSGPFHLTCMYSTSAHLVMCLRRKIKYSRQFVRLHQ